MTAGAARAPILQVEELIMTFGGLSALMNIDLSVSEGSIKAVIGPNGAGKTTLFNTITGALKPTEGTIRFQGREITNLKAHQIARVGISRTFQTVELFKNMSALENILVGRHMHSRSSWLACGLRLPFIRRQERRLQDEAMEILDFIGLAQRWKEPAGSLALGEQKILEIGRALATHPKLICLDEPAAGLNETESDVAARLILAIRERGITVLLVEHDMQVVMAICDEIVVLNYGQKLAEGSPAQIQNDPSVIEAYLGAGQSAGGGI